MVLGSGEDRRLTIKRKGVRILAPYTRWKIDTMKFKRIVKM